MDISQIMPFIDEVIAGIDPAVTFNDRHIAALFL